MRSVTGFCVLCLFSLRVSAQTVEIQQLQVNIEKLAQLKTMLSQMKQGYEVLEKGYNSVRDAAKGNFDLHRDHLDALLRVSTAVRNSDHTGQVGANHAAAKNEFAGAIQKVVNSRLFNAEEISALRAEWTKIHGLMAADKQSMDMVLTNGVVRMNDAERVAILASVNRSSVALLAETRKIIADHLVILMKRSQHKKDIEAMKRLRGIK